MSIIIKSGSSGNLATIDSLGNLQVLTSPAALSSVATPWTSATSSNTAIALLSTGGYSAIVVQLNQTSTISGGVVTFEGTYDGINWGSLPSNFVLDPQTFATSPNPYTLQASTNHTVLLVAGGFQQVRVRLSTVISGTGSVTVYSTLQSISPLQELSAVTVTGTVVVAGSLTNNNAAPIANNVGVLPALAGSSAPTYTTGNQVLLSVDLNGNLRTTVLNTVTVSGTVAATQSGTWSTRTQDGSGTAITSTGSALDINLKTSSITLPVSLTSTTITGTVAVTQSTTPWTVAGAAASGAAKSGNPVQTGAVFNTTQPTVTTGQAVENQATARGAQIVATGVDAFNVVASGTVAISGTVGVTQSTSPWVVSLTSTAITGTVAVTQSGTWNIGTVTAVTAITNALPAGTNVIGHVITDTGSTTAVTGTVTVSGSVTANIGTTGGITVAQGSTTSGQSGPLMQGAVTTAAPAYTTAQTSPLSLDPTGNLRTSVNNTVTVSGTVAFSNTTIAVTNTGTFAVQAAQSGTWNIGTVTAVTTITNALPAGTNVIGHVITDTGSTTAVTGTVAVTQSTSPWVVSLTSTTITGTVAVTQSITPWTIQGDSASGAAKAGNPVQIGGVFNTTQPTVTTGQTVESQATARGAQIVATGVDTFNVTVNTALPAGANVIGHVISDSGSTTAVTGNVTVVQATAASLNATVTGTVAATQSGTWTDRIVGNAGATLDFAGQNAASPANAILMGAQFQTTPTTITPGNASPLQMDNAGNLLVNVKQTLGTQDTVGAAGTLNALNATATIVLSGNHGVGFQLAAGTLVGTIVPEISYDGGTTWVQTYFIDTTHYSATPQVVFGASNTATGLSIDAPAGASNARVRVSVFTSGTASCVLRASDIVSNRVTASLVDGAKFTYRAVIAGTTPLAQGTSSPSLSLQGSATKTIRITRIRYGGWSAGTGANITAFLRRFSALSGGTPVTITAAKMDTNDPAASAVAQNWTAVATTATAAALIATDAMAIPSTVVTQIDPYVDWQFGVGPGAKELVLRGTADFVGVTFSAVGTTPTALAGGYIEWTEE